MRVWILLLCGWLPGLAAADGILVLGDSLGAGYGLESEQGWVSLLDTRVARGCDALPVHNASVSGETTAGGRARLAPLLDRHEPDLVILELGGNDGLRGLPPTRLQANLEAMIALSRESGARVLLVGIRIPPNYGAAYTRAFDAAFEQVVAATDVAFVPFLLEGVAPDDELMQADGIHPTAAAQPRMLDNVWPALVPLLPARCRPDGEAADGG